MNNRKQTYIIVVFTLALVIGVGYALLNSTLNITGNTKIKENSWDVHFENFAPKSGSVTATSAGINTGGTAVNYTVTLSKPGDFYEFTVDVVNEGSIDAMINTISNTGLTNAQKKYMTYSVSYSDGTEIAEKQKLEATTGKETIKVKVEYKKDISAGDLPSTEQTISLTFSVNYVQADGSAIPVRNYVCRRATTLHTETCSQTGTVGCKSNTSTSSSITYGNLGTTGTLAAGDAFDCDVNGDGTFDASTERFYYVAPLDTNSNYGVLVYYNNVSGGAPSNTTSYAYNTVVTSGDKTNYGPITAKTQLPTTSGWKNVSLYNTTRSIKDETGTFYTNFNYEGYAARLLTYQEIVAACGAGNAESTGYLDNCKYLMENTAYSNTSYKYGYWLDSTSSVSYYQDAYHIYIIAAPYRLFSIWSSDTNSNIGVRPAIEVPKSKISY